MPSTFRLAAALALGAALVSSCQSTVLSQSSYFAATEGEFGETGNFAAEIAFVVDYAQGTFDGELRNLQVTRGGFDRPAGTVPFSGAISRDPEGQLVLKATGTGPLTQDGQDYALEIEFESFYVTEDRERITGGFWGGGEFSRDGEYVDWLALKGRFEADAYCKPSVFRSTPCPLPPSAGAPEG